jgi:hypothetical protein
MNYSRVYADDDGVTHFGDASMELSEVAYAPPAPPFLVSDAVPTRQFLLCGAPAGWEGGWHPAPARQFVVLLQGELEIEAGDGEVRQFGPGTMVLLEDTTGRGHATRVIGDVDVRGVFLQLPDS